MQRPVGDVGKRRHRIGVLVCLSFLLMDFISASVAHDAASARVQRVRYSYSPSISLPV